MPPFIDPPALDGAGAFSRWGDHRHLGAILHAASRVMFLTGAGLSAPSGIPTYRGVGGKWMAMEPVYHQEFVADEGRRLEQWRRTLADHAAFSGARPNRGHAALARFAGRKEAFVATQNVDGLHGESGIPAARLAELHGNGRLSECLSCRRVGPLDAVAAARAVGAGESPRCEACGGLLKPGIVMFGGTLDPGVQARAVREAEACIAFVAVGTSLRVHPAAGLLEDAVEAGAVVVIVNDGVTPYHGAAHLLVAGDATEALDRAVG